METVYVVTFYNDDELTTEVMGVYRTRESADRAMKQMVAAVEPSEFSIHEMPLSD